MSKYRMDDGTVVDTDKASAHWSEATYFDGRNHISRATGTQWDHQTLWRSRKGRYYLECWSDWQGSQASAEWISKREAARWLTLGEHEMPEELAEFAEEATE